MPNGAGTAIVKSITTVVRYICFALQTALTIYPSIYVIFVQASTTQFLGYADTRSCATGIRSGNWERRFWIPPTTRSPSTPCSNTMMFPAIIDLNVRRSEQAGINDFTIGKDGVPICPIGRKMVHWGKMAKSHRRKWRCPAKCGNWVCQTPCSPSEYGRTFYTSKRTIPGYFLEFAETARSGAVRYSKRTCVERCNKRQKIDYKLEDSKGRSSRHWTMRTMLIAMCQHADAWLEVAKKNNQIPLELEWLQINSAA